MKAEKFSIQACCGKKAIIFKIDGIINNNLLNQFIRLGFKEYSHFTKAGILYVDNEEFIVTGPMGTDKLQVKCRKSNCDEKLNNFDNLLLQLE